MTASLLLRSPDQPLASSRSARVRINTQYLGPYICPPPVYEVYENSIYDNKVQNK